ncbi:hypothetical protein GCM10025786_33080 [Nocardioides caeni]
MAVTAAVPPARTVADLFVDHAFTHVAGTAGAAARSAVARVDGADEALAGATSARIMIVATLHHPRRIMSSTLTPVGML